MWSENCVLNNPRSLLLLMLIICKPYILLDILNINLPVIKNMIILCHYKYTFYNGERWYECFLLLISLLSVILLLIIPSDTIFNAVLHFLSSISLKFISMRERNSKIPLNTVILVNYSSPQDLKKNRISYFQTVINK